MCEIQLIKRFNEILGKKDVEEFLLLMWLGSQGNPHAYGMFNTRITKKEGVSFSELKGKKYQQLVTSLFQNKDTFLVGHNRLATQGDSRNNGNNHPFESENFLLVHNGIINNDDVLKKTYQLQYSGETDSLAILYLLEHYYKSNNNVQECIKKVCSQLEGSFSVMVYNKNDGNLYYFKNDLTEFSFGLFAIEGKKVLVGSTEEDNLKQLYKDSEMIFRRPAYHNRVIATARAGVIYVINNECIKEGMRFSFPHYCQYGFGGATKGAIDEEVMETVETFVWDVLNEIGEIDYDVDYKDETVLFRTKDRAVKEIIERLCPYAYELNEGLEIFFTDIFENYNYSY